MDQCHATIQADPDIGGTGVLVSFVVIAVTTAITALLYVLNPADPFICTLKSWLSGETHSLDYTEDDDTPWIRTFSAQLLEQLCDLQIITGLAISIAGVVQIHTVSFYHLALIVTYWSFTFNSMVMAQIVIRRGVKCRPSRWLRRRSDLQDVGAITSMALAIYLYDAQYKKEQNYWNRRKGCCCYRSADFSSPKSWWLWQIGLYIVIIFWGATTFDRPSKWMVACDQWLVDIERRLIATTRSFYAQFTRKQTSHSPQAISSSFSLQQVFVAIKSISLILASITFAVLSVIWWCTRQWLAVWILGTGTRVLVILVYFAFTCWDAADAISIKILNQVLMDKPETSWGFGQVLPIALLGAVTFNIYDAAWHATDTYSHTKLPSNNVTPKSSRPIAKPFFGVGPPSHPSRTPTVQLETQAVSRQSS